MISLNKLPSNSFSNQVRLRSLELIQMFNSFKVNNVDDFVGKDEDFYFRCVLESYFLQNLVNNFNNFKKIFDIGSGIGVPGLISKKFSFLELRIFENNPQKVIFLSKFLTPSCIEKKTFKVLNAKNLFSSLFMGRASLKVSEIIELAAFRNVFWLFSSKQTSELSFHRSIFCKFIRVLDYDRTISCVNMNVPRGTFKISR